MISIRKGVFETNSSSVHSLVIADAMPDLSKPLTVHVKVDEYGWGPDTLTTPGERGSYLYTAMCCSCAGRNKEPNRKPKDPIDDLSSLLSPWGVTVVCDEGARFVQHKNYWFLDNGYIDHDEDLSSFVGSVMEDPPLALRFIFSDDSIGIIYNDNMFEDEWDRMQSYIPDVPHIVYEKGN